MNPQPKLKPYRNENYLDFIRSKPCGICHKPPRSEAHHARRICWGAGARQKPHDYVAVSRCPPCHRPENEVDVEREIIDNLMAYAELKRVSARKGS
uniref:Uncharacterized protein n=1 Tax=viral metagenome TaxID=1070528 RepID=A0A6M3X9L5_9ZZZZ